MTNVKSYDEIRAETEATSDSDTALSVRKEQVDEERVEVLVENVTLKLTLKVNPGEALEQLQKQLELVEMIKAKFGEDSLFEQLKATVGARIESVTIVRATPLPESHRGHPTPQHVRDAAVAANAAPPPPPRKPPKLEELSRYTVVTACPWQGYQLGALSIDDMTRVLNDASKVSLLHPQDVAMMSAYLIEKQREVATQTGLILNANSFADDDIPF